MQCHDSFDLFLAIASSTAFSCSSSSSRRDNVLLRGRAALPPAAGAGTDPADGGLLDDADGADFTGDFSVDGIEEPADRPESDRPPRVGDAAAVAADFSLRGIGIFTGERGSDKNNINLLNVL